MAIQIVNYVSGINLVTPIYLDANFDQEGEALNELRITNYELNWKGILTPTNLGERLSLLS